MKTNSSSNVRRILKSPFIFIAPDMKALWNVILPAKISSNTNVGHLSYIGDAQLGENVNIGAGTITANYNPLTKTKSKTIIADNVKIGSNSVLVAPVEIQEGANVGAGGIITKTIPKWALAITRSPLKVLENWVKKQLSN